MKVNNNPERCIDNSQEAAPGGAIATISTQEHSKLLPWLMMCAILSGVSVAFSIAASVCCWWLAHEYHVLQIIVQDQDALMIREGFKQPEDSIWGPQANFEYKPRRERQEKK